MKRPGIKKPSPPRAPPHPPPLVLPRRHVVLGILVILAIAAWILWAWWIPGYGAGVDEAAYMLGAKGLATHMDPGYPNPDPLVFMPETMIETRPGVFYPGYPVGFPLLAAIGYRLGGPAAAFLVNPVLLLVALVGVFFLAREFVDDLFALAATYLMATHPTVLHFGVAALSHASDLAVCTWALYFACAWWRRPAAWKLGLAGLLAGYAVSIRYTEALLVLPLGYAVGWRLWEAWRKAPAALPLKRLSLHVLVALAAGVAGVAPLMWFQWRAFGSPFTSSYASTGQSGAFSWSYFVAHVPFALKTLVSIPNGLFIWFPLGLVALFLRKWVPVRQAIFLALASIPLFLVYSSYYWVNYVEPVMYVRFFLTLFPVLIIAALMPAETLTRRARAARIGVVVLIALIGAINLSRMQWEGRITGTAAADLAAVKLAQTHLPPDAVIVGDGFMPYSLVYYTDMTVIYPLYFSGQWTADRLNSTQGVRGQVTELNGLRMQRFQALVGGKNQQELYDLLESELLDFARHGRRVALLTSTDNTPWYGYLQRSFTPVTIGQDNQSHLVLIDLRPR